MRRKKNNSVPETFQREIAIGIGASSMVVAAFEINPSPDRTIDARSGAKPSPEVIMQSFSLESRELPEEIGEWAQGAKLAFNLDTPFILNCTEFHERTKLLALPADVPTGEDDFLTWLIAAARTNAPGADNLPLFGANADFDNNAFLHYRMPGGQFGLTSVPRRDFSLAVERVIDFSSINTAYGSDNAEPVVNLQIETPTRALARFYFDAHLASKENARRKTAFLSVSPKGYAIGLFSPEAGDLIYETAEPFEKSTDDETADFFSGADISAAFPAADQMKEKITHAIGEMQAEFRKLNLTDISEMVWATTAEMQAEFEETLFEMSDQLDFETVALDLTVEEAVAYGLLLSTSENSALLTVNLVRDLVAQSSDEETELKNLQAVKDVIHRHLTVYALLLPFLAVIALTIGLLGDTLRASRSLTQREEAATTEQAALKPTLDLWNSYTERFTFYSDYTKQMIALRNGQDRAINLFTELDSRYPLNLDGSFYVSDLKLSAGGNLEMKGMARDEKAITAFVESLETSKTVKNNQYEKTFGTSLTFDLQQGAAAGKGQNASAPLAPGIVLWTIKGNYAPMVAEAAPTSAAPNGANPALTPAASLKPNQIIKSSPGAN